MLETDSKLNPGRDYLQIQESQIPLLKKADIAVVGGSLVGVAAANKLAREGLKVVLIESRTYLGREITAKLRPWIKSEFPVKIDDLKISLEDSLLQAGVDLIYASHVVDLFNKNDKFGLIIGNKSGQQLIMCKVIIDASEFGSVLSLTQEEVQMPMNKKITCWRTLEFINTEPIKVREITVPKSLGIKGNTIKVHSGYRGGGHVLVEFPIEFNNEYSLEAIMVREMKAREISMDLVAFLLENEPEFKGASFTDASHELFDPGFKIKVKGKKQHISKDTIKGKYQINLQSMATSSRRLWYIQGLDTKNAEQLAVRGESLASFLVDNWDEVCKKKYVQQVKDYRVVPKPDVVKKVDMGTPNHSYFISGNKYGLVSLPAREVPIKFETEVLVVGGGSSGAMAAINAAVDGVSTTLVDMNPGPGGTGTYGGVDSYWFGRKVGFSARIFDELNKVHKKIKHQGSKWNIHAREFTLRKMAAKAGVKLLFNTVVINVLKEENKICGVLVAGKFGVFAILADIIIDATGDGDIAAFAGGKFIYGSEEDHSVMWYSLAQFPEPGRTKNNFTSMVDISDIEDYTRAILVGRRRNEEDKTHDHGIYVAPRESRHIIGDYVLNQTDQLKQRKWEDVINIHFSNTDIKGKSSSRWIRMGLIPPNLEIEIPYRVLLPQGLEGLLVVGKAISVTHDALPPVRMQADLENLGGVAGLAAAMAVKENKPPRIIDIAKLQKRLVREGILPERILNRTITEEVYSEKDLCQMVKSLAAEKPLYSYSNMDMDQVFKGKIPIVEVCTAGKKILPFLLEELNKAKDDRRILIAKALAFYGHKKAIPVLLDKINYCLSGGTLPLRDSHILYAGFPPDQGAMPDVVYLIYSLGYVPDERNIQVWERVVNLLPEDEESFRDGRRGLFYYIDAVCFGAANLGSKNTIPLLKKLHKHNLLNNLVQEKGFEVDYFWERQAMLELAIGRALFRCGSYKGFKILASYLNDNRSLLARQAYKELLKLNLKTFYELEQNIK